MEILDRSVVSLRPKQPFLDWMMQDDPEGLAPEVYEDSRREPTAYLVPEAELEEDRVGILELCWPVLFEMELGGWSRDPETWPESRTLAMFQEWCEITWGGMVVDLMAED